MLPDVVKVAELVKLSVTLPVAAALLRTGKALVGAKITPVKAGHGYAVRELPARSEGVWLRPRMFTADALSASFRVYTNLAALTYPLAKGATGCVLASEANTTLLVNPFTN